MPRIVHAPCTSCGRPMVTREEVAAGVNVPGAARYGSNGECNACAMWRSRQRKRGGVRS